MRCNDSARDRTGRTGAAAPRGGRGGGGAGGGRAGSSGSSRETLLAAVALQDHIARTMRLAGGPKTLPSTQPGAEMTLAQHLGLIPRPPPLLSETEWNEVHLKARLRQHSTTECPICQEDFKQDPQVLLSCSHVFHKSCLGSFERYAKARCCPLCRAVQYQKRVIQDGTEAYKDKCATRIQAAVRGWLARRRYKELRKHRAPNDPRLKRTWAAERLEESTSKMVAEMEAERGDVDRLFAELDASLALSRAVCDELTGPAARRLQERLEAAEAGYDASSSAAANGRCFDDLLRQREQEEAQEEAYTSTSVATGTAVGTGSLSAGAAASQPAASSSAAAGSSGGHAAAAAQQDEVDWPAVVQRAKARGTNDCPICIGRLNRKGPAGIAWLSCTHAFHLECICAFEAYELSAGGTPSCPVCRAKYQRRCFK